MISLSWDTRRLFQPPEVLPTDINTFGDIVRLYNLQRIDDAPYFQYVYTAADLVNVTNYQLYFVSLLDYDVAPDLEDRVVMVELFDGSELLLGDDFATMQLRPFPTVLWENVESSSGRTDVRAIPDLIESFRMFVKVRERQEREGHA